MCFLTLFSISLKGQHIVYFIHGQGADERQFSKLLIPENVKASYICYQNPLKNETMSAFASRLVSQMDTTEKFSIVGVSLGGMLAIEITNLMPQKINKLVLISSAESRKELPLKYRFQKYVKLYKVIPPGLLKRGAKTLQAIIEKEVKSEKKFFRRMLEAKEPIYFKRTIGLIINWKPAKTKVPIIRIHGSLDNTLPIKLSLRTDFEITNGGHMMVYTQADEVSKILSLILK